MKKKVTKNANLTKYWRTTNFQNTKFLLIQKIIKNNKMIVFLDT